MGLMVFERGQLVTYLSLSARWILILGRFMVTSRKVDLPGRGYLFK